MVGEGSSVRSLAKVTSSYVGKPYKFMGWQDGFDCGSFLISILENLDIHKVAENSVFAKDRYHEIANLWLKSPEAVESLVSEYLEEHGIQVEPLRTRPGDVMIYSFKRGQEGVASLGIYGGNGHIISAFKDKGVTPIKVDAVNIKSVYRLG